jgi:hypothetical protein
MGFGKKPQYVPPAPQAAPPRAAPPPTIDQAVNNTAGRVNHLEARMRKTENDINSLKAELSRCRPGTSQHNMYKRRILAAMKERKRIDMQINSSFAMQSNLTAVQDASYQMQEAQEHGAMLMEQNKVMKAQMNTVNADAIADAQDEMRESLAETQEITEMLGEDYGVDGIDDADLEAELEGLGDEMGFSETVGAQSTPSYVPSNPAGASAVPSYLAPGAGSAAPAAPQYGR